MEGNSQWNGDIAALDNQEISLQDQFKKLQGVHRLQSSIARQNMHNALSPISAISGYLELLKMTLCQESVKEKQKIDYYGNKIQKGLVQVNNILEQMQEIYQEEAGQVFGSTRSLLKVDLNWIVSEVYQQMHFDSDDHITLTKVNSPIYIKTDLFIAKLIIFNLLNYASHNLMKGANIEIKTSVSGDMANFSVIFEVCERKREELAKLVSEMKKNSNPPAELENNSFNEGLLNSTQLAGDIDGTISYMGIMGSLSMLKLSVPVAG